jgi:hypothetical protein
MAGPACGWRLALRRSGKVLQRVQGLGAVCRGALYLRDRVVSDGGGATHGRGGGQQRCSARSALAACRQALGTGTR